MAISAEDNITFACDNVGIGTTSPTAKLHVLGGSNDTIDETTANFKVQGSGGNGTMFGTIASSPYTSYIQSAYVVDTSLAQYNLALNPIGGNVGIGTTGPTAKLFVDGKDASNNSSLMTRLDTTYAMGISNEWVSTYVSKLQLGRVGIGSVSNIDFIYDIAGTEYGSIKRNYTASSLKFERGTTVDMIINGSGNVGIGTTTVTTHKLIVSGGSNIASFRSEGSGQNLKKLSISTGGDRVVLDASTTTDTTAAFAFQTGGVERMRILDLGGIKFNAYDSTNNTGTPTYLLGTDASGNIVKTNTVPGSGAGPYLPLSAGDSYPLTGNLVIEGNAKVLRLKRDANQSWIQYVGSNDDFIIRDETDGRSAFVAEGDGTVYFPGGNVGIGVSNPETSRLLVRGSTNDSTSQIFQAANLAGATRYAIRPDGDNKWYKSDNSLSMILTSGGNVGIGVTDPEKKLEVKSDTTYDGIMLDVLSSPEITFRDRGNSDTLVGTGRYALDGFHIDTYSGNAFFIKGSNRFVGIGTTSPTNGKLVIDSTANQIAIETGTAGDGRLNIGHFSNGTFIGTYGDDGGVADNLRFGTHSGDERMRIDSAGAIKFNAYDGTSQTGTPTYVLGTDASGNVVKVLGGDIPGGGGTVTGTGTTSQIPLWSDGPNGVLGNSIVSQIGTGRISVASSSASLTLGQWDGTNNRIESGNRPLFITSYTSPIKLGISGSTTMTIESSNVGIGTTSPDSKLHVKGISTLEEATAGAGTQLKFVGQDSSGHFNFLVGKQYNISNAFEITPSTAVNGTTFTNPAFIVNSAGNVGIGTISPAQKFVIANATNGQGVEIIPGTTGTLQAYNRASSVYVPLNIDTLEARIRSVGATVFNNGASFATSESMRIDSAGNVGIGTTSPDTLLQATNTADGTDYISYEIGNSAVNANNKGGFAIYELGSKQATLEYYRDGSGKFEIASQGAGNHISLSTNAAERMRITSAGDVGIGATPTTGYKLDVVKTNPGYSIVGSHASGGKVGIYSSTGDNGIGTINNYNFNLFTNNSAPQVTLNTAGNVGIGTTSPPQKLAVIGNISLGNYNGSDFSRSIGINDSSGVYGNGSSYIKFNELSGSGTSGTTKGAAIEFYNHLYAGNTNQTMIIQANGNVGIGMLTPTRKLVLDGTLGTAALEILKESDRIVYLGTGSSASGADNTTMLLYHDDVIKVNINTVGDSYFNGGDVGIGVTAPSADLHVNSANAQGTVIIGRTGNNLPVSTGVGIITFPADYNSSATNYAQIRAYSNALSALRGSLDLNVKSTSGSLLTGLTVYGTNAGANVGIGTTSPTYKLDVVSAGDGLLSLTGATKPAMIFKVGTAVVGGIQAQANTSLNVSAYGTSSLNLQTAGTAPRLTILTGGNVGIGTTNPSAKFVVADGMSGTNSQTGLEFIPQDSSNRNIIFSYDRSSSAYRELNFDASNFKFNPGGSTQMVISSSGNVGIGTTNPATQLEIFEINDDPATLRLSSEITDGDLVGAIISFSNDAGGGGVQGRIENVSTEDDTTVFKFYTDNTSSPSMTLFDSGNMTIAGTLTQNSDVRLKENIKPIESALDKVKQMQGVEFNKINSSTKEIGVVAQEIEKIIPELVLEDKEGIKSVAYGNITAVLIEAIKEQQKQIEELKQQLNK